MYLEFEKFNIYKNNSINKKYLKSILLSIILIFGFLFSTIVSGNNQGSLNTIYVDDDNIDGPWNGSIEYPFQFIQDGIDNAYNGDIVMVFSGIYYESIEIFQSIQLIGENKTNTIIENTSNENFIVYIDADEVTINNFTIQNINNKATGIHVQSGNNSIINDNIILKNLNGIVLSKYSNNNIIHNNNIKNNNRDGIFIWSSYNMVYNNIIINNSRNGIGLLSATFNEIHNNYLKNNNYNIYFDDEGYTGSKYNNIHNNTILKGNFGIHIADLGGNENIICNNTIYNQSFAGIYIMTKRNIIHNNIFKYNSDGLMFNNPFPYGFPMNDVKRNHFEQNDISISSAGNFNLIFENNFVNSKVSHFRRLINLAPIYFDYFDRNYWDSWDGTGIHIIKYFTKPMFIAVDFNPAIVPYQIP